MNNPKISVIIPVFNREALIGETITSVLDQSYIDWECLLIDDGSTDDTESVIQEYVSRDERLKYHKRPESRPKGASASRNFGLELAKGEYIQFLDSDDLMKKNKIEEQLKILEKEDELCVSTCKWGSFRVSSHKNVKTKWYSYGNFSSGLKLLRQFGRYNEYMPLMAYLISRKLCNISGPWNESLTHNDDGEYFSRILLNASKVRFCSEAEVYYRAGDSGRLSLLDDEDKIRSAIESWILIRENLHSEKKICHIYSQSGIQNVYRQVKDSYPEIIADYSEFFKENTGYKKWYERIFN